jgi:hypothetical protein
MVWITSLIGDPYNSWVYYSTWHWQDKNYSLGPANVEFLYTGGSGQGIVEVKLARLPQNVYGRIYPKINNCREWIDGEIWINKEYHPWESGKFATVIRHEIGHAAGLQHEPDDTSVIMYPYLPEYQNIPRFKSVKQDDINGLGCLYGGSFNWGDQTFTLEEPKGGATYECEIPVSFGACNGVGALYNITIYIKYDANNPGSPWIPVATYFDARGCNISIPGRNSSSPYTQVKVEFYQGTNLVGTKISGIFNYQYSYFKCQTHSTPDKINKESFSKCNCEKYNFLLPEEYEKIELFDVAGRKLFSYNEKNKEFIIDLIKNLPKGIYFLRVISNKGIYVKKLNF